MEINFKELTLKGDRPLVFILSGAGLSAESGIPTLEIPTASGENTIQRSSLLSAHLKGIHKMYLTSITKESKTPNRVGLTQLI